MSGTVSSMPSSEETCGEKKMILFEKGVIDKQTEVSMLIKQTRAQWSDNDLKRVKDLQKYALDKEDGSLVARAMVACTEWNCRGTFLSCTQRCTLAALDVYSQSA